MVLKSLRTCSVGLASLVLAFSYGFSDAFVPKSLVVPSQGVTTTSAPSTELNHVGHNNRRLNILQMGLDMVTYLRTEWVSAALCTNQTPRTADVCLQLGVQDGRAVTFIPRSIEELITSSPFKDGKLSVSAKRQLIQQRERRGAARVTVVDQRADDLSETADESVDIVISLQAAAVMDENGLDWKKSIIEAARVLKPGGRFLFVEQAELNGDAYLEYVEGLKDMSTVNRVESEDDILPMFTEVGWDNVDLVIVPHIAGVAIKSESAGMTASERERKESRAEKDRIADKSIEAYERGLKKRRRKKKKGKAQGEEAEAST